MINRDIRIVFMGTPEFAGASLKRLIDEGLNIVGVVTAPDKPSGRGKKMKASFVKTMAEEHGLKVLQPTNLKDRVFLEEFKSLNANLGIVVAFRMLPEVVWSMPEFGTFNFHASLLPNYRGAAPINHAIMNGETETGVTTFFLKQEIDTGDIIYSESLPIGKDETFGELHDRLMASGASLVIKTVRSIESDNFLLKKQDEFAKDDSLLKNAPKIYKEDCRIEWSNDVKEIYNKIRGLSPYPAAFTEVLTSDMIVYKIKIYKVDYVFIEHTLPAGSIETDGKSGLSVYCKKGRIDILELQVSGKKRMDIKSFLNGFNFNADWKLV